MAMNGDEAQWKKADEEPCRDGSMAAFRDERAADI